MKIRQLQQTQTTPTVSSIFKLEYSYICAILFEFYRSLSFFWQCDFFDSKKTLSSRTEFWGWQKFNLCWTQHRPSLNASVLATSRKLFASRRWASGLWFKSLDTLQTELVLTAERWDWMNELLAPDSILNIIVFCTTERNNRRFICPSIDPLPKENQIN